MGIFYPWDVCEIPRIGDFYPRDFLEMGISREWGFFIPGMFAKSHGLGIFIPGIFLEMGISWEWGFFSWDGISHQKSPLVKIRKLYLRIYFLFF